MGLLWNGQQVPLRVNPDEFRKNLAVTQRKLEHQKGASTSCFVTSSAVVTAGLVILVSYQSPTLE